MFLSQIVMADPGPSWEDMVVTSEMEHTVAEIQASEETEHALPILAREALDTFAQPAWLIQLGVIVDCKSDSTSVSAKASLVLA